VIIIKSCLITVVRSKEIGFITSSPVNAEIGDLFDCSLHRGSIYLLWTAYKCTQKRKKVKTNTNTNIRHTQCVNNEIHIGGRQDRYISKLITLDKQKVINNARWCTISVVSRRYTISHTFHVNTVQIRQTHIQSHTTQLSIQTDKRTCSSQMHTMMRNKLYNTVFTEHVLNDYTKLYIHLPHKSETYHIICYHKHHYNTILKASILPEDHICQSTSRHC